MAAESTSFKYGFVHDAISGFEAILGDGRIVWCSRSSNSELFYAIPGTFGTVALITRVNVICLKAEPFVKIFCTKHKSPDACVEYLGMLQDKALVAVRKCDYSDLDRLDFLEGLGFSPTNIVTVAARFCSGEEKIMLLSDKRLGHSIVFYLHYSSIC